MKKRNFDILNFKKHNNKVINSFKSNLIYKTKKTFMFSLSECKNYKNNTFLLES